MKSALRYRLSNREVDVMPNLIIALMVDGRVVQEFSVYVSKENADAAFSAACAKQPCSHVALSGKTITTITTIPYCDPPFYSSIHGEFSSVEDAFERRSK